MTGRYRRNRSALGAVSVSAPTHLTCVDHDYGYDYVFSRYLEAHARAGDVVALSTNGKSANIIKAVETARDRRTTRIVLTSQEGSPLAKLADITIVSPAGSFADRKSRNSISKSCTS